MNKLYDMALTENGKGVLYIQLSPIHGYGLFTNTDLPVNTILCRRLGLRFTLSLRDKRAIIGIDGIDPDNPDDHIFKKINHSCHPIAYLSDTGCLINIERVLCGEEIIIDYSKIMHGSTWQMFCTCGQKNCRGIIKSL